MGNLKQTIDTLLTIARMNLATVVNSNGFALSRAVYDNQYQETYYKCE
jgi:hypothetical protein